MTFKPNRRSRQRFHQLSAAKQEQEGRRHMRYWADRFSKFGDPRLLRNAPDAPATDEQMEKLGGFYDAWLRGDWNDVPGIITPPGER